jgi:hypothetical protein
MFPGVDFDRRFKPKSGDVKRVVLTSSTSEREGKWLI